MMSRELYRASLRVLGLVCAFVLVFDSGIISPITRELSNSTYRYVATNAIGVLASVAPNEINTLTAELTKREQELEEREASLNEREIATRDFGIGINSSDRSTYILSAILFILMTLIVINYIMDWNRMRMSFNEHTIS